MLYFAQVFMFEKLELRVPLDIVLYNWNSLESKLAVLYKKWCIAFSKGSSVRKAYIFLHIKFLKMNSSTKKSLQIYFLKHLCQTPFLLQVSTHIQGYDALLTKLVCQKIQPAKNLTISQSSQKIASHEIWIALLTAKFSFLKFAETHLMPQNWLVLDQWQ